MRIAQKIAFISLLFFTVLLSSFLPSNSAHADVLSIGVSPKWTNWMASWQYYVNISNSGVFTWGTSSSNTVVAASDGSLRVKKIRFNLPNGLVLVSGDYITAEMVYNLEDSNNSNDMIFGAMKSDTSGIGLIDVTANRGSNAMGTIKFTFKVEDTIRVTNTTTFVTVGSSRGGDNFNIFWFNEPKGYLQGSVVNFYGTRTSTDYTGGINDLKNGVNNLNSKLGTTNQKLDDVKNEIKNQSEQQQNQYESEKEEEGQREEDMNGQSEDAQGIFNFNVLNPFSGLFGLFSNSCSVSIPILASWIHAPSSTYTSWWCANDTMTNIKNTLTPVFGIASMMLLFGFVVRWLSHNSGDIYGARNMNKGLNG